MDYINIESENQKSGLIILLVMFHSACPYKKYCLKCFTELQTLFIYLSFFFFLLSNFFFKESIECKQGIVWTEGLLSEFSEFEVGRHHQLIKTRRAAIELIDSCG